MLSISLLQSYSANASVMKPCSKTQLNKVAKDLKCQKVGNLYRWVKVTTQTTPKVPSPTPTVKSSEPVKVDNPVKKQEPKTFIPWSTDFDLDQMVLQSNTSWDKWEKELKKDNFQHFLIVDESLPKKITEIIKDFDMDTAKITSNFINKPTYTLVGQSCSWAYKKIKEIGTEKLSNRISTCEENSQYITYMINSDNLVVMIIPGTESSIYNLQTFGAGSDIAHEYFHGVQVNIVSKVVDHYNNTNMPQWFLEGSASYFAYSVWCRSNKKDCNSNHNSMIVGQKHQPTGYTHGLSEYTSTENRRENPGYKYPYDIGYRAVQYLTASAGADSMINIMKDFKDTNNFAKSFQNVTNISLSDFYKNFDASRSSINFPPITANR